MSILDLHESTSHRDAAGQWVHRFVWPEKPPTMNQWNLMHHRVRAQLRAEWREAFLLMARGCAPLASCHVHVNHLLATRRRVDVGACFPAVKAAVDGIVLAGVLEDDGPAFVTGMTFQAPLYAGRDAVVIELIGPGRALDRDRATEVA